MIWEREFGIDAEGFTSDCINLLCKAELEEWRQRDRDSWLYEETDLNDAGFDDPEDYNVNLPPLTKHDLQTSNPVASLDEARARREETAADTWLYALLETIYGPKETA